MKGSKCVPSELEPCEMYNKTIKCVRIMKMTPLGGASGAILENYENMLASPGLNLCGENFFHKSVSK